MKAQSSMPDSHHQPPKVPVHLAETAQGPRGKAPSPGQGTSPALQQLQCTNKNYKQELLPRPGRTTVALEVLTARPLKYYFFPDK